METHRPPAEGDPGAGAGSAVPDWDGGRYDRLSDPQFRWGTGVLERLPLAGSEVVLDAGCGSGRVTEALAGRLPHGTVVALDGSASMLARARTRLAALGDRVRFVRCDLLDLGPSALAGAAPVDAVFSTATFHWVTDHERLFTNLASVLRPGGRLVAQCGAEGNIDRVVAAARRLGVDHVGTWLYASPADTVRRLRACGFADIDVWTAEEPTRFADGTQLMDFLETACLRECLATIEAGRRRDFVRAVAESLDEPVIDYVRLNISATRT